MPVSMETAYIYGLCDPITQQIRYVGKTNDIKRRMRTHLLCREKSHLTNWIKSLKIQNVMPEIFIIEEIDEDNWQESERFWIAYFKFIGANLVNQLPGGLGGGVNGHPVSLSTREKISNSLKGENHIYYGKVGPRKGQLVSQETREKLRIAFKGKPSPKKGTKVSDEIRKKLSESHKGLPSNMTPETEARRIKAVQAACKGKPLSEEHKAKLRAAKKNRKIKE